MTGLERLASGRTAEIFALPDEGRVLKLFFPDVSDDLVQTEARYAAQAHALRATPIACHGPMSHGGRRGLVFDRLSGPSLVEVAEGAIWRLWETGRLLAQEQVRLHRCDGSAFPSLLEQLDRADLGFLSADQRRRFRRYLAGLPDGSAVLHMDFHSSNVFVHGDGLAVIDWQTPLRGAPGADVAVTRFLLAEAELTPGTPWHKQVLYNAVRRQLRSAYQREYLSLGGLSPAQLQRWRLAALAYRLSQWDIDSERARLQAEIAALLEEIS